jgi:hypothetical protein
MKHLKLYEAFNEDSKIKKVNDFILYFLLSSYFEKNTEITTENDGTYYFFAMTRVNKMRTKKWIMYVFRKYGLVYVDLNYYFQSMRLKRYLRKCIGNQDFLNHTFSDKIKIPIENYLRKKFKFTEEKFNWDWTYE